MSPAITHTDRAGGQGRSRRDSQRRRLHGHVSSPAAHTLMHISTGVESRLMLNLTFCASRVGVAGQRG